jgi:hypothetical protein
MAPNQAERKWRRSAEGRREEMRMKKWIAWASAVVVMVCLTGCGSDLREVLVGKAIDDLGKAASTIQGIRENVEKWEAETKDAEKKKFLDNAISATDTLKQVGQGFQGIKQATERLEPSSREQREELRRSFRDRLDKAIERLRKEQRSLNDAITRADGIKKGALAELKEKLQQAQGEFEVLTKPR